MLIKGNLRKGTKINYIDNRRALSSPFLINVGKHKLKQSNDCPKFRLAVNSKPERGQCNEGRLDGKFKSTSNILCIKLKDEYMTALFLIKLLLHAMFWMCDVLIYIGFGSNYPESLISTTIPSSCMRHMLQNDIRRK